MRNHKSQRSATREGNLRLIRQDANLESGLDTLSLRAGPMSLSIFECERTEQEVSGL